MPNHNPIEIGPTGCRKLFIHRQGNRGLVKERQIGMSPFYVEGDNKMVEKPLMSGPKGVRWHLNAGESTRHGGGVSSAEWLGSSA
jgi:hypothetical protein